jgi:hypothetical protein
MLELTGNEFVGLFGDDFRDALLNAIQAYPEAVGMVAFTNCDLSSRYCGRRFAILYGPTCTITPEVFETIRTTGQCPVRPPAGHAWQYRVDGYCHRDQLIAELTTN